MNKFTKILLSLLGGVEVTFYIFTPIIIAAIWVTISNSILWQQYLFYGVGFLATIFRAIKVGFFKDD